MIFKERENVYFPQSAYDMNFFFSEVAHSCSHVMIGKVFQLKTSPLVKYTFYKGNLEGLAYLQMKNISSLGQSFIYAAISHHFQRSFYY